MARMNINKFFTAVLGAQLKNPRWSWGARDPLANRIFLRVWDDQIQRSDGADWLRIGYGAGIRRSNGLPERTAHIQMLRSGAEGFGVICIAKERIEDEARKIISFDDKKLARLGEIRIEGEHTYAKVEEYVPVSDLIRPPNSEGGLAADLRAIGRMAVDITTKEVLANARLGQGQFRADVLSAWGGCCAVTGSVTPDAIRASHIKPWRSSNNHERLDPRNGLPLVATLDALFDAGLISFSSEGSMMISKKLDASDRERLGLEARSLRATPSAETGTYLHFHRTEIFRK